MAYELWSQDSFSKGELSPYMYARATVTQYSDGLKTAQNVLTYPTGAAGKRFGTLYQSIIGNITQYDQFFFATWQYLNECIYQLVFTPGYLYIYLEGLLEQTVTNSLDAKTIYNLSYTVLGPIFRITGQGIVPTDLTRSTSYNVAITGVTAGNPNEFTVGAPTFGTGVPFPVFFTTSSALPTTTPQIKAGVTYFMIASTTTSASVYSTAYDAKFGLNPYVLTNAGTGTNNIYVVGTFTLAASTFKNLPFYDFNASLASYDALTFTPSATMGAAVTITISSPGYSLLSSAYVGGVFIAAGGSGRITAVASVTSFTVAVQMPFDSTDAVQGSLVVLAEPAWSDARGWPQICSSYQNRALFANTTSLPNGFYASVINDYADFGDLTNDADDAISWYPTSDNMNFIRFIVPYRSITVHTNTGIYSSPLSDIVAITPTNFTLQLQDSTPADVLQPQAIDNQILVISGNDCHQMLWDGINNAYTSDIVSVISEQVIRDPVDETAYADLRRAGSRYVFIINSNGSMAVFQTLISQSVSGFVPQIMEQTYGNAYFRQSASSADGRCWFVVERQIAITGSPTAISGFTSTSLTATATNFSTTSPIAVLFATTGTLPTSIPQIVAGIYYWAVGIDANTFSVYLTLDDAMAGTNEINFSALGSSSTVTPWPLYSIFVLEELTTDTFLDCAFYYNGTAASTIDVGQIYNAQNVKMVGYPTAGETNGFGFEATGAGNNVIFNAHGQAVEVEEAYIGFPITTIIEPMPLSMANGPSAKNTTLTKPKHIRTVNFMFNNTIGGTINGVNIALAPFNQAMIGEPPFPERGVFQMSIMKAWDDFNNPSFTIVHDEPFNIELLGVFYAVDI